MVLQDPSKEFASGLGSAVISLLLTYPITKCIYRQILDDAKVQDSIRKMRKEGSKYLYRGILPPMFQRCTELSIMFGMYSRAKIALIPLNLDHYQERAASSTIAGVVASGFTPFERAQMLLTDSRYHSRFKNMFHVMHVLGKDYGFRECYRGYTVILCRNVIQNLFFFTAKENLYGLLKYQKLVRKSFENFLVGGILGLSMTTLFYPLKVLKTTIQVRLGGEFYVLRGVKEIYGRDGRGIRNFYRGLSLNIFRSFFSWGITNVSYEFLRNHL